mgnify:CR=1 FL=1
MQPAQIKLYPDKHFVHHDNFTNFFIETVMIIIDSKDYEKFTILRKFMIFLKNNP